MRSTAIQPVLGTGAGVGSVGYGTVRPSAISDASIGPLDVCDILWHSWGGPVARGVGRRQDADVAGRGLADRVSLTASDLGMCAGTLTYRFLQADRGPKIAICC